MFSGFYSFFPLCIGIFFLIPDDVLKLLSNWGRIDSLDKQFQDFHIDLSFKILI